ncbi:MAG TPA: hypothetical protein DEP84_21060 [Chloroflexi bacterium]|nr:hypothetical protein [Chloroflexota bacterium]
MAAGGGRFVSGCARGSGPTAEDANDRLRAFATTVACAVATERWLVVAQVGDGVAVADDIIRAIARITASACWSGCVARRLMRQTPSSSSLVPRLVVYLLWHFYNPSRRGWAVLERISTYEDRGVLPGRCTRSAGH